MTSVLTLIGPGPLSLGDETFARALDAVAAAGGQAGAPHWLSKGEAVDIPFSGADPAAVETAARAQLAGERVDLHAQTAEGRRKKLLIADMDSTVITVECLDELADFAGLKPEIAAITERAMRGELDFEAALTERVAKLKGLDAQALERCYAERVTLTPGARTLVRTMRAHGATAVLVSGGFTFFTVRVAAAAGFQEERANRLLEAGGKLTGAVAQPILGRDAKRATLLEFRENLGLAQSETLAVGDGANDLAMIEIAGLGVAYHAKPVVAEAAAARIEHATLAALLFLQGYARDEFVTD